MRHVATDLCRSCRIVVFLLLWVSLLSACSTLPRPEHEYPKAVVRIYRATYEEVWNALLKVLDAYQYKYPSTNKDAGYLETDFLKGESSKEFYYSGGEKFSNENKVKLKWWASKPSDTNLQTQIKITVEKEEYISGGFLEGWSKVHTDFLTEEVLLYRIERTIDLERSVNHLTTKP